MFPWRRALSQCKDRTYPHLDSPVSRIVQLLAGVTVWMNCRRRGPCPDQEGADVGVVGFVRRPVPANVDWIRRPIPKRCRSRRAEVECLRERVDGAVLTGAAGFRRARFALHNEASEMQVKSLDS